MRCSWANTEPQTDRITRKQENVTHLDKPHVPCGACIMGAWVRIPQESRPMAEFLCVVLTCDVYVEPLEGSLSKRSCWLPKRTRCSYRILWYRKVHIIHFLLGGKIRTEDSVRLEHDAAKTGKYLPMNTVSYSKLPASTPQWVPQISQDFHYYNTRQGESRGNNSHLYSEDF